MAILTVPNPTFHFRTSTIFENHLKLPNSNSLPIKTQSFRGMSLVAASSRKNTRTESAKTLNRRRQNKFNGTASKPRLSVFCSGKQLYAMLVDDRNKKSLFYGSTLQKSIRGDPPCSTIVRESHS
ncbi:50S ribosomal protein L18 [Linum grandiflorum]